VRNTGRLIASVMLAVLAGGWIALGQLVTPPLLGWAAVAAVGFTVAGSVLQTPTSGARNFTVVVSILVGLVSAALVGGSAVAIGLAALAAMIAYARVVSRRGALATLGLAVITGLPFAYGALAVGRPAGGVVPWILASWLQLIRALVADLETPSTDRARTVLSAVLALGFVPASLVLPARAGYGGAYFLLALFAQLAVLVTAARLIVGRIDGVNPLLKGAMVIGAVAMVAGRVT
jgi:hypothetical protein